MTDGPFSLADRVIQWTFDPTREGTKGLPTKAKAETIDRARMFRQEFKHARRFVLDDDFVREWAQASSSVEYLKMRNRCDLANLLTPGETPRWGSSITTTKSRHRRTPCRPRNLIPTS